MNILGIIPARGGSKGVPGKNIKPLNGVPLLWYTLQAATWVLPRKDILVSTDDLAIQQCAQAFGIDVPFLRPAALATDTAGSYEVLLHAWEQSSKNYDAVLLLQVTSPFRTPALVTQFVQEYQRIVQAGKPIDMLVSVGNSPYNPYYNLFEEAENGCLQLSKPSQITRRQDAPSVYFYTGSMYLITASSLLAKPLNAMQHIHKFLVEESWMNEDIDTPADWQHCEQIVLNQPYIYESYSNYSAARY